MDTLISFKGSGSRLYSSSTDLIYCFLAVNILFGLGLRLRLRLELRCLRLGVGLGLN